MKLNHFISNESLKKQSLFLSNNQSIEENPDSIKKPISKSLRNIPSLEKIPEYEINEISINKKFKSERLIQNSPIKISNNQLSSRIKRKTTIILWFIFKQFNYDKYNFKFKLSENIFNNFVNFFY